MTKVIVFDGPDGVGKSTQAKLLAKKLPKASYHSSPFTNDFDGGYTYSLIKENLKNGLCLREPETFQKLFHDNRNMWIRETYSYAVRYDNFIIIDRWCLSTFIYGIISCIDKENLKKLVKTDLNVDLQFIFQHEEEKAFANPTDVFERMNFEVHGRYNDYINGKYDKSFDDLLPKNNCIINANQSIEKVHEDICNELRIRKFM